MSELAERVEKLSRTTLGGFPVAAAEIVVERGQATVSAMPCEVRTTFSGQETLGYLRTEFPSECWYFPLVATTVTQSLAEFFLHLLPKDPRIEHVYWFSDEETLKIWTVIPEPDFDLEEPIYNAQMEFMAVLDEYECDFNVIYRFGKSIDDIKPQGAYVVL